ncbi:MAG: glycoside hydrolase family 43 protein [Candidatus Izemoplasmatales bacterium]
MKYHNPIISGFHPDPSVCRVGEDYYLVTSTFEYFPGIPIYHSRNLLHWELIGHCINRDNMIHLKEGHPNAFGLYAPTIRYHQGVFYVVCTNVAPDEKDHGNFLVWSRNPRRGWSQPLWLDCPGIDPSLFFDDDGKIYYTGTDSQIYLCEIDVKTGVRKSTCKNIWEGSGGNNPEGPHLYKRHGYYYLLIAEGGTELGHMVTIARSRNVEGPYESCPRNPILTNRGTRKSIKAVGHADIFCDHNHHWWATCLGIRPISYPFRHNLGRETMLAPMEWDDDGWPVFIDNQLDEIIETDRLPLIEGETLPTQTERIHIYDDFKQMELDRSWNFIYRPLDHLWSIKEEGLWLRGDATALSDAKPLAWLGKRQLHHVCKVKTALSFRRESDNEEAGLSIYLNHQHHYEIVLSRLQGINVLFVRRQIGMLWKIENIIPYDRDEAILILEATRSSYAFKYIDGQDEKRLGEGETIYLTTEVGGVFTGNYVAIYASGNGRMNTHPTCFHWFEYDGYHT